MSCSGPAFRFEELSASAAASQRESALLSDAAAGKGLILENVRKSFGATEVIRGIDIAIADGEFVVLAGRPVAASRPCCG
jgi:hypothetical protein